MYIIENFDSRYVIKNDKIRFNIENIKPKPLDYNIKINLCNLNNWIDKFNRKYKTFTILKDDVEWLLKAQKLYHLNGKFSSMYNDEIDDFVNKYNKIFPINDNYFVRAEGVSLKYGLHGVGPYTSMKQIVESIISTPYYHSCLHENNDCKLYLFDWIYNLSYFLEFRIFIFNNKITGISQQHLYKSNVVLNSYSKNDFYDIIDKIKNYYYEYLQEKLDYLDSYTIDLSFIDNEPYFIEVNPFGSNYSAGSSLFHWILDEKLLYNTDNIIYFRYTS